MMMWMNPDLLISGRLISRTGQPVDGGKTMAEEKRSRRRPLPPGVAEAAEKEGKIQVRICGRDHGLEQYDKVSFVRVVSKRYNLLIMADYLPIIGEVEGSVFFRTAEKEYRRENLMGYFMHKNNEFSLMLKSEGTHE